MSQLLAAIVEGLNPDERQELVDACDYMAQNHASPVAEGSIARVLNGLSPRVRERFATVVEMLETPRMRPFDPKMGNDEYAEVLGADPQVLANIKGRLDNAAIVQGLQRRMGTTASQNYGKPDEPATLRELLGAAIDLHQGGE